MEIFYSKDAVILTDLLGKEEQKQAVYLSRVIFFHSFSLLRSLSNEILRYLTKTPPKHKQDS